jgi:hypothetical protein
MTFHVGQKVVCVDDTWVTHFGETTPEKGAVYTVRDVRKVSGNATIHLVEVRNEPAFYADGLCECSFGVNAFRPAVQPRKELPESITKYLNVPGRVDA